MNYDFIGDISKLYLEIIEEGLEEKIPKLMGLVDNKVEGKEEYIRWAAATFDPSKNSSYITWILRMLKKGVLAGEEDGQKVKERLSQFEELKRKPQFPKDKRDINSYKTYGDLAETLDEFSGVQTKGELKRSAREEGIQYVDSSTGTEGSGISLYIVTTEEAGAKYFRDTDWCVKDPRFFEQYGSPYYFFTEDGKPKTLLHLDSNQCMDVRDRPTDLDGDEQSLMETEEMTDYVISNDNSDDAMAFYVEKVGDGYDNKISDVIMSTLEKLISDANSSLKMFSISDLYLEELKYYQPDASGYIEYDFTPYEEHIGDKDFLAVIEDVLGREDIYVEDFKYSDPISDDMKGVSFNIRYENDNYRNEGVKTKLESFIRELEGIESSFDIESFDETLREKLLEAGYITSGWASFKNKVDLDSTNFQNFHKGGYRKDFNAKATIDFPIYGQNRIFTRPLNVKYNRSDHPYVAFSEFIAPLLDYGVVVELQPHVVHFKYEPKHKEDQHQINYIKELKMVKNIDKHFDFYVSQIQKFLDKFVIPQFQKYEEIGAYDIPENLKIPLLQIKSRKDSSDQGMLDLHEKTFKSFFLKHYEL